MACRFDVTVGFKVGRTGDDTGGVGLGSGMF